MKKSDIEVRGNTPTVNVKTNIWSATFNDQLLRTASADAIAPERVDAFIEWWHAKDDDRPSSHENNAFDAMLNGVWEWSCRDGWEMLQDEATEILGDGVKVFSDGRSGGWAIVEGLDDVEGWDAIAVSRWAKFHKAAKAIVKDIPFRMVWSIAVNIYEVEAIANDEATALDAAAALSIQAGE